MNYAGGWRRLAMTLAETVMALALMGVLIVVVVGFFSRMLMASAKSTDQTAGRLLAHSVLERAAREGPPNWGVAGNLGSTAGGQRVYAHDSLTGTDFVYRVDVTKVSVTRPNIPMGEMYQLDVTVTWWKDKADAQAQSEGVGQVSTQLKRTVYIRE